MRRNWRGEYQGKRHVVPGLEDYDCPACGEKGYDAQAMRKIEACSLAFRKKRPRRRVG